VNILVMRTLGIGDLATAVPALRALRTAHPTAHLSLAVPAWLAPLAGPAGPVDTVVETGELERPDVTTPDLAVNLHGRGPQSHRLLQDLHPKSLWAFACTEASFTDGPQWTDPAAGTGEHEVHRWCRMLDWYGVPTDVSDLGLSIPDVAPAVTGATIVHPGAKSTSRRWPVRRFASVAHELTTRGHHVVVTGSEHDEDIARRLVELAGLPPDRCLAGHTGVLDLAALVASARLVISGDTGIAHLATGYATPSVTLFGPVSPAQWGPPAGRRQHRALWRPEPVTGEPPAGSTHPALLRLTVHDVLDAVATAERHSPGRHYAAQAGHG
jgi:ADP-heptose:LPS heptosyltransferase